MKFKCLLLLIMVLVSCNANHKKQFHSSMDIPQVSTGVNFACALDSNKSMFCWGYNKNRLGRANIASNKAYDPELVDTKNTKWKTLSSGHEASCGITEAGNLLCWGNNAAGVLGKGETGLSEVPTKVKLRDGLNVEWVDVEVNRRHACAIDKEKNLWCWGVNTLDQVYPRKRLSSLFRIEMKKKNVLMEKLPKDVLQYMDAIKNRYSFRSEKIVINRPIKVGESNKWLKVALGYGFTCGIDVERTIRCWGGLSDVFGKTDIDYHVLKIGNQKWHDIAADGYQVCAINSSQELWCWGRSITGPSWDPESKAVIVRKPEKQNTLAGKVINLDIFYAKTCVVTVDHALNCWYGMSGNKKVAMSDESRKWMNVSVSDHQLCAVTSKNIFCKYDEHYAHVVKKPIDVWQKIK